MKTSPNIHKYELAEEIGISEHMAEEFRLLFRELFPQEPKEIMSKKEINARYYSKRFGRNRVTDTYSSRSVASQNTRLNNPNNY